MEKRRERDVRREKHEGDRYSAVGCGGIGVEDTVAPGYTSRSPSHLTCSFAEGEEKTEIDMKRSVDDLAFSRESTEPEFTVRDRARGKEKRR